MWYMQEKPKIIWVPQHGYYTLNNLKQDVDPLFQKPHTNEENYTGILVPNFFHLLVL